MADKRISDLTLLTSADTTDIVPVVDVSANTTKQTTVAGLAAAVGSSLPAGTITNTMLSATAGDVGGAWSSWTPTWTNLTVGNGMVDFKYTRIGKTIHIRGKFVFGSTSSISGNVAFTAPVNYHSGYNVRTVIGNLSIEDAGTASYFGYVRINDSASSNLLQFGISNTGSTYASYTAMTSSVPMTWANGDQLMISATYEAA